MVSSLRSRLPQIRSHVDSLAAQMRAVKTTRLYMRVHEAQQHHQLNARVSSFSSLLEGEQQQQQQQQQEKEEVERKSSSSEDEGDAKCAKLEELERGAFVALSA